MTDTPLHTILRDVLADLNGPDAAYHAPDLNYFSQRIDMKHFNDKFFGDRLKAASEARLAMLKRAEKPAADDPKVLERKAEREAIAAARVAREEAKAQAAIEKRAREEAEAAERAAAAALKAREEADLAVALQAEQKAARDARYAARKKRKAS